MYQLSRSVSATVIVSNSLSPDTTNKGMLFTVYASLERWMFTSGVMQDDMSDHPDDHPTLLHPWLKTAGAGHSDSPSSICSRCTRGLKRCCNPHGLTDQHWILLLYLGRQLQLLRQAVLEMSGQGVLRVDSSYSFIAFMIPSAGRPKGKHQKSILFLCILLT